jgi:PAS domain S-box-containing protein
VGQNAYLAETVTNAGPFGNRPSPADRLAVEQARATLALEAADLGEFEWDAARDLMVISPRMARMTGLAAGEHQAERGEFLLTHVHPEDREGLRILLTELLTHEARYRAEYRHLRPDDHRILWMESAGVVVRNPNGQPQKLIGVVRDVSDRKVAEQAREALVAELDHRVKNVLASVQSLAAQSARKTTSVDSFLRSFNDRLQAMAAAHTLLTLTRWRGSDITDLVAAELGPLAHGRARWAGPSLLLSPRATSALGLALHELATNALKFGALSTEAGRVEVRWHNLEDGGFELFWVERRGPQVSPPARQGFGMMLLDRVTGPELGGEVDIEFRPEGVQATLRSGLTALADTTVPEATAALRRKRATRNGVTEEANADISGLKVLVIEDAMLLAVELEEALNEAGASVVGPATSLDEAIEMMDQDFDVVLLDADLNGHSAAPIASALSARGRPFILATGHKDAPDLIAEAPAATVSKPYNVRQISFALAKATGRLAAA